MFFDIQLFFYLNDLAGRSRFFDALIIFFADYLQYLLAALFLVLVYRSRQKLYFFLVPIVSTIAARLGVVTIIRFFYHRPRPFMVYSVHQLIGESGWSFPSGHSAFFFAFAAAIYLFERKWGIVFFLASTLMNVSRVISGVHYPSDIIGGMIIGIVIASAVFLSRSCKEIKENT